jgi:hypothetical protein
MTKAATALPNGMKALCFCLLATFTLLSGCSGPSAIPHPKNISQTTKPSIPPSKEQCLVQDNLWVRQGLSGSESCRVKTADSQKVCEDSMQCEGLCLADMTATHNLSGTTGTCSAWANVASCHKIVEAGTVREICFD